MADSLGELFIEAAERFPERVFLRHVHGARDVRVTYGEAAMRLFALRQRLSSAGIRPGAYALVYLHEMVPSLWIDLACALAGVIPVPIGTEFSIGAARQLAHRVRAEVVIADERLLADLGMGNLCVIGTAEVLGPVPEMGAADAIRGLRTLLPPIGRDDIYMIQPTSGTTGQPKLAERPHLTFLRVAEIMSRGMRVEEEPAQRVLMVAALTHGMGQYLLGFGLHLAAEFDVPGEIDTAASLAEVRQLDPTYLGMTPRVMRSFFGQQKKLGDQGPLFGPGAKSCLVSGAVSDVDLLEALHAQGIDIFEGYGASEISVLATNRRGTWRPGLAGEILKDVELRLDEDGELLARCPGRMRAYFGDPELTQAAFTSDGYYRTGDYCEITPDGHLRYLGRKKDVFNTFAGANVHPGPIETEIERWSWVDQVVLIGDQKPYLSALIVVHAPPVVADAGDGYLTEPSFASLYERARTAFASLNAQLETFERIEGIALFGRRMGPDLYKIVGHSKISRNRNGVETAYRARIEALYGRTPAGEPGSVA